MITNVKIKLLLTILLYTYRNRLDGLLDNVFLSSFIVKTLKLVCDDTIFWDTTQILNSQSYLDSL